MTGRREQALELTERFVRTGGRYLWTDAFAVMNLCALGLADEAAAHVTRVTAALGCARGMRIGKPMPERPADEPFDPELEWDRDGQYFHYLTKWMLALHRVGRDDDARRLMIDAHAAFTYGPPEARRMYWKMSVDLSRPLVRSMGQHDPLDGYVTSQELGLAEIGEDFRSMIDTDALDTTDPLGLGGLLMDARRLADLRPIDPLAGDVRAAAERGLRRFKVPTEPPKYRLAFRELGLSIGLGVMPITGFERLRSAVESFWLAPAHRTNATWRDHEDINDVMLATSLLSESGPNRASSARDGNGSCAARSNSA